MKLKKHLIPRPAYTFVFESSSQSILICYWLIHPPSQVINNNNCAIYNVLILLISILKCGSWSWWHCSFTASLSAATMLLYVVCVSFAVGFRIHFGGQL